MIGGALARPCLSYPELFPRGTIWDRYPYLLPNLFSAATVFIGVVIGFLFLEETHTAKKLERDAGRELGERLICLVGKVPICRRLNRKRGEGRAVTQRQFRWIQCHQKQRQPFRSRRALARISESRKLAQVIASDWRGHQTSLKCRVRPVAIQGNEDFYKARDNEHHLIWNPRIVSCCDNSTDSLLVNADADAPLQPYNDLRPALSRIS